MVLVSETPSKLRERDFQLIILYPAKLPIKYEPFLDTQGLKFIS